MKNLLITLTMLLLASNMNAFAQLNPINNLLFQDVGYEFGNYYCPQFNCYALTWEEPDASISDTLIGYKLYKNGIFYKFTELTNASCEGWYPCDYLDFFDNMPFWLTVKAVYNKDSLVSMANDSIYFNSIAINVDDKDLNKIKIMNNPVKLGDNITIFLPNKEFKNCALQIISPFGQIIKEYEKIDLSKNIILISTNKLSFGLYILNLQTDNETFRTKLIVE